MKTVISYFELVDGKPQGRLHTIHDVPIPSKGDRVVLLGHHEFGDIHLQIVSVVHEFALGSTDDRGKTVETSLVVAVIGERVE